MKIVGQLKAILGLDKTKYDKGLKGAEKSTSQFGSQIKKLGGVLAGAFAVSKIIDFAKEASALAGKAEGIEKAFNKIDGVSTIDELRASVKGTVSDMELMRNTVVAATLGLEASKMPELFAFAAKRANETGESVQFLVDSIVKGIGRKSPLILDNLGISAIDLRKALGEVSMEAATVAQVTDAVAKIAREATGDVSDLGNEELTTAEKTQALSAETENLKVALGNVVNEIVGSLAPVLTKFASQATKEMSDLAKIIGSDNVTGWQKLGAVVGLVQGKTDALAVGADKLKKEEEELAKANEALNESLGGTATVTPEVTKNIGWYKEEIKNLKKDIDNLLPSQEAEKQAVLDKITAYEKLIGVYKRVAGSAASIETVKPIEIKVDTGPAIDELMKLKAVTETLSENFNIQTGLWSQYMQGAYADGLMKAQQTFAQIGQITQGLSNLIVQQKNNEIAAAEKKASKEGRSEKWLADQKTRINKEYAKEQKAIALAQAIINTAVGVTQALAQGGVLGIVTGALVAAAGAIEISTISSQGMARGGVVPNGFPNDSYPTMLTSGETVIPPKKLPNMNGGGQEGTLRTEISGRNLAIILDKWQKDKSRIS